jgi:adenylate kinase
MIEDVIVLLGAPGAGKGTQAQILAEKLGLAHVATGDMFRDAVADGTPVGRLAKDFMDRGELVPDEVVIEMLFERLAEPDAELGVILDGFPRNLAQAEALNQALEERGARVSVAPYIEVAQDELTRRLSGRWICRAEGHSYHEKSKPPTTPGVCDIDGSELYQRSDDQPETVKARLSQQLGVLGEVVEYYRRLGVLVTVDGSQPIEKVAEDLLAGMEKTLGGKD